MRVIRRVGVLGAGAMGSRIAAHFANAGVPALLLDIVLPEQQERNAAAIRGIENAARQRPPAFFTESAAALVTPGNFEDDLPQLQQCDWILEAVSENLDIKRSLIEKALPWRREDALFSTNTSGLPLARLAEIFPTEFRRHFFGAHFFNPPRYLHLLELIPGPETDPEILGFVAEFADLRLGKGVAACKDTPNFIANRIGSFLSATVCKQMIDGDFTIEEVDALTGPLIGAPRSASFRLLDIIGLDVWTQIARNLHAMVPNDPWRDRFVPPDFQEQMVARGLLGDKSGQGFYRRVGKEKEIWALDWKTLEYHPARKAEFLSLETTRKIPVLGDRLRAIVHQTDRAGAFIWSLLCDLFLYAAGRVPEISDRVVEIDRAMRWGYGHQLGPFELWDALGFEETLDRMHQEGRTIPGSIEDMVHVGATSFYLPNDQDGEPQTAYFDLLGQQYALLQQRPGILDLYDVKRARGVLSRNAGASLIELGDGILCLEFHGAAGQFGEDQIEALTVAVEETERNYSALLVTASQDGFCLGTDLGSILHAAEQGEWDEIDASVRRWQRLTLMVKYAAQPVVMSLFGVTQGLGCEFALVAARIHAQAELAMGFTEIAAGLIPAAGGCAELLLRFDDPHRAMELIFGARVSTSAAHARELGLLGPADGISMNPERLLHDAKAAALALLPTWAPRIPGREIRAVGDSGFALLKLDAWLENQGHRISDYDLHVAGKLAYVLSGGRLSGERQISEQYMLDLEREAFLSLCGQPKTQERLRHLLATGKALKN